MRGYHRFLGIVLAACLSACATGGPIGTDPSIVSTQLETLPAPQSADYTIPAENAAVRPLDTLKIEVFGVDELTREVQVDGSGAIAFPLIGSVEANGLSTRELARTIEDRLRGPYLRNPDVTVSLAERPAQLITVGGEVGKPGQYPVIGSMTLMDAIAVGGGLNDFAKRKEVIVFRTVAGQRYVGIYNLVAIQRGNYRDPEIYPNDVVMVGESPSRRLFANLISTMPLLTTAVVLIDRLSR